MSYLNHDTLQKELYTTLSADSALVAMVSGIYDTPPQGSDFPYVLVGDITGTDWSSKTHQGMQASITLHIYTRDASRKPCSQIMERIYALLHLQNLSITNQTLILLKYDFSSIVLQDDGATYHGILRLRGLIQFN